MINSYYHPCPICGRATSWTTGDSLPDYAVCTCAKEKLILLGTWTCNNFEGHYPGGTALVVNADNEELARIAVEQHLASVGLPQTIKPEQLVLLPNNERLVRILNDGNY